MSTEKAVTTERLRRVLLAGAANGRSVETLAFMLDTTPRGVRKLREELIDEGVPVCAHPKTGYYIAATWEEVEATYDWLRSRGLHTLSMASKLRAAFTNSGANPIDQLEAEGAFES
jgi:biotin operon repressor